MRDLPCYTPEEPRNGDDGDGYKYSVCKCGHAWHEHQQNDFQYGIFLWTITFGHRGSGCDKCKCDIFRKLGKFTYEERQRLEPCEESQNLSNVGVEK